MGVNPTTYKIGGDKKGLFKDHYFDTLVNVVRN
jgi:hypothetical protein